MRKTEEILKIILENKKLSAERVYSDEPLIFTASQMKNYTPPEYAEMKKIISSRDGIFMPSNRIFYKQAKFMEKFEDKFDYQGEFIRYFPTYRDMSNYQLRGYFSWRTDLRHGELKKTAIAFAFVYIYELLNGVGISSKQDGHNKLKDFAEKYGEIDRRIVPYINKWIIDYVVYHNLDSSLLADVPEFKNDNALITLMNYKEISPQELLTALCNFSSYKLLSSSFYKKYPEEVADTVYRLFGILAEYYGKKTGGDIFIRLFGRPYKDQHFMFDNSVFYEPRMHKDCVYEINPINKFICKNGNWYTERFYPIRDKAGKLGGLLKNTDYYLRQAYSYKSSLKLTEISSVFENAIKKAINEHLKDKREKEKPVINIDVSLLAGIRSNSEITREKLIIEEEVETEEPIQVAQSENTELEPVFCKILKALILGQDADGIARKNGIMLSLAVDKINDTFFDRFGDTVIIYDGDNPEIIEDYTEDLKGILKI